MYDANKRLYHYSNNHILKYIPLHHQLIIIDDPQEINHFIQMLIIFKQNQMNLLSVIH